MKSLINIHLDMVGVTGSIPVARTIETTAYLDKPASLASDWQVPAQPGADFILTATALLALIAAMIWASYRWLARPPKVPAPKLEPPYQPDQEWAHHPQDEAKLTKYLEQQKRS